jgi:hypothetical protein
MKRKIPISFFTLGLAMLFAHKHLLAWIPENTYILVLGITLAILPVIYGWYIHEVDTHVGGNDPGIGIVIINTFVFIIGTIRAIQAEYDHLLGTIIMYLPCMYIATGLVWGYYFSIRTKKQTYNTKVMHIMAHHEKDVANPKKYVEVHGGRTIATKEFMQKMDTDSKFRKKYMNHNQRNYNKKLFVVFQQKLDMLSSKN